MFTPGGKVRLTLGGELQSHYLVHQTVEDDSGAHLDDKPTYNVRAGYLLGGRALLRVPCASARARASTATRPSARRTTRALRHRSTLRGRQSQDHGRQGVPRAEHVRALLQRQRDHPAASPDLAGRIHLLGRGRIYAPLLPTVSATAAAYENWCDNLIVTRGTGTPPDPATGTPGDLLRYENSARPRAHRGGRSRSAARLPAGLDAGGVSTPPSIRATSMGARPPNLLRRRQSRSSASAQCAGASGLASAARCPSFRTRSWRRRACGRRAALRPARRSARPRAAKEDARRRHLGLRFFGTRGQVGAPLRHRRLQRFRLALHDAAQRRVQAARAGAKWSNVHGAASVTF